MDGPSILERLERLEHDNERLRAEIVSLRGGSPHESRGADASTPAHAPQRGALTRRGLLAAGLGAAVASAAATAVRPRAVSAHDTDDVRLGADNPPRSGRTLIVVQAQSGSDAFVGLTRNAGTGVVGQSTSGGAGVVGYAGDGAPPRIGGCGVVGFGNGDKWGVYGKSTAGGTGVYGASDSGTGIEAFSAVGPGVSATGGPFGVTAAAGQFGGVGVYGTAHLGTGIYGVGTNQGRGGVFRGDAAQVRLVPADAGNHPDSGRAGDLFLDSEKRLWMCKGGATWVRLG